MRPSTADDVLDLLDVPFQSAALGAALELGLFWLLDERPLEAGQVARELGIPLKRCHYWLQLLVQTGLIEAGPGDYRPSSKARSAILEAYDRGTWKLLADRITYHPADFFQDELPTGFDLALECDVNVFSAALFRKIRGSLRSGGRPVILDEFGPSDEIAPPSRLHWAFEGSMVDPDFSFPTASTVKTFLEEAGFQILSEHPLPPLSAAARRFDRDLTLLEARADSEATIVVAVAIDRSTNNCGHFDVRFALRSCCSTGGLTRPTEGSPGQDCCSKGVEVAVLG